MDVKYGRLYDDKILAEKMDGSGYIFLSDDDLVNHLDKAADSTLYTSNIVMLKINCQF